MVAKAKTDKSNAKETPEQRCVREIRTLHTEINGLHSQLAELGRRSVLKVMRVGELLTQAKEEFGHGHWGQWIEDNLTGCFTQKTAQRYMNVWEKRDKLKFDTVSNLSLNDVYVYLGIVASKPKSTNKGKG